MTATALAPPVHQTLTVEGPRDAHIDSDSGLRFYTWAGRELPSVTSIRRAAGIPHGLHQWTLSQVIDRAVLDHAGLTAMLTRERRPRERVLEKNRIREASTWLRSAATEERDRAAALGTAVHDAAARGLTPYALPAYVTVESNGKPIEVDSNAIAPRLGWYRDWLRASGIEILAAERQVWNLTLGYAGSFDILGRYRDGSVGLIDLKTGEGTYADYAIQQVGYLMAEHVGADGAIDNEATGWLRAASRIALLHLSDTGWEYRELIADADLWGAFRGLLAYAQWSLSHRDAASITRGIRQSVKPVVTHEEATP